MAPPVRVPTGTASNESGPNRPGPCRLDVDDFGSRPLKRPVGKLGE
jgi:hypothetical protein